MGLVKQRTGLTDQDLIQRVRQMEGEQYEGRGQAVKCVKCGRTVPARKARCMYCGGRAVGRGRVCPGVRRDRWIRAVVRAGGTGGARGAVVVRAVVWVMVGLGGLLVWSLMPTWIGRGFERPAAAV